MLCGAVPVAVRRALRTLVFSRPGGRSRGSRRPTISRGVSAGVPLGLMPPPGVHDGRRDRCLGQGDVRGDIDQSPTACRFRGYRRTSSWVNDPLKPNVPGASGTPSNAIVSHRTSVPDATPAANATVPSAGLRNGARRTSDRGASSLRAQLAVASALSRSEVPRGGLACEGGKLERRTTLLPFGPARTWRCSALPSR
jgi:hypothetical protein